MCSGQPIRTQPWCQSVSSSSVKRPVFMLLTVVESWTAGVCVCVCAHVVNPILVRHMTLSTIWLQPSTPPTKHLGCDLQCASCHLISWSRNRVAVTAGLNETQTFWLTRGVITSSDVMWHHNNVVLCLIISQEAFSFVGVTLKSKHCSPDAFLS